MPEQAAQLRLVSAFATQQLARNDRRSAQPAGSNIPLRPEHTVEESSWYNFYSLEKKHFLYFYLEFEKLIHSFIYFKNIYPNKYNFQLLSEVRPNRSKPRLQGNQQRVPRMCLVIEEVGAGLASIRLLPSRPGMFRGRQGRNHPDRTITIPVNRHSWNRLKWPLNSRFEFVLI